MPRPRSWSHPEVRRACIKAPFGALGVISDGERLTGIELLPPGMPVRQPDNALLSEACRQLAAYLLDPRFRIVLPLDGAGTGYQRRVWKAISAIPCGMTRAYGEIASDIGSSARAVGQACGANPFPVAVPCHRVIASSGVVGGFMHATVGFPLFVKRWLLAHERR